MASSTSPPNRPSPKPRSRTRHRRSTRFRNPRHAAIRLINIPRFLKRDTDPDVCEHAWRRKFSVYLGRLQASESVTGAPGGQAPLTRPQFVGGSQKVSRDAAPAHDVAVLIVAYRSADKLEKCLRAAQLHLPHHRLYVWDNSGPSHPAVRELAKQFDDVRWFTESKNIGFAAAVNALAATVPGRDMLLLNPDAELLGPLTLTHSALREPGVAAAAPMVADSDDVRRTTSLLSEEDMPWDVAHRRVTLVNAICGLAAPPQRLRGTFLSDRYRSQPHDVTGYLTGACLAIRRDAWDVLGPLDEEFFLYGEEADWQSRAKASGWTLRLADEVGVFHSAHGTVEGDSLASKRSDDLFRAGVALQLEYRHGEWAAGFFLAATSLLEFVKSRIRNRCADDPRPAVMVTVDARGDASSQDQSVSTALQLAAEGHEVTLVSLCRLGALPRDVPPSIRLIRRPWWWPSTAPERTPTVLVEGTSGRERAFGRLFQIGRRRTRVQRENALSALASGSLSSIPALKRRVDDD